ncbi:MAG: type VI secretion system tip protein VgrG [Gammaproteobacteria bacterium]|nr:type VI secretion system tip protein VgrG [Gammaproteobacteria bacterium]
MAKLLGDIEHFIFEVSGLSEELKVVGFRGSEDVSKPYSYTLELACENVDLDFDTVVGKPGVLTLIGDHDNIERHVHGIVSRMCFLRQVKRFAVYEAELVPQLSFLDLRHNCRIFQNVTVPQIIESVLKDAQIASDHYKLQLNGKYEAREYCVQYRETDLHFIARLMEEEGIYYFFEHSKSSHLMMVADSPTVHAKIAAPDKILFHDVSGSVEAEDSFQRFAYTEQVQSGQVAQRDFNFKKPALGLEVKKQQDKNAALEVYDYPGGYEVPGVGDKFTQVRLDALQAQIKQGVGTSNCMRLVPGFSFTLAEYPQQKLNQDYFLTQLKCRARQPQVLQESAGSEGTTYTNDIHCMPASTVYRTKQALSRPKVSGVQTAIVVGPAGEEIYVDEHGRVKVQFHWDRQGKNDEKSSCWIRVSQLWAGASWGAIFTPRIGQEVIVGFLEGNLDRPLITGRVYHGTNRPPYPLPAEKTKSTIKSDSSKGGEGSNELRFEDLKDKEEVYLHGQKDWNIRIENDTKEWIGHDRHLIVQHDQLEQVKGDKHQKVVGVQNVKIDGTLSIESGADTQQKTAQNFAHEAGSEIHFKAGQKVVIEAGVELTIKVGGSFVKIDASGVTIVGAQIKLNSGGSAGSGSGAAPEAPKLPMEVAKAPPAEPVPAASPAATVLKTAAQSGTPFCEECDKAKKQSAVGA